MSEAFWYTDPSVLIGSKWYQFVPTASMSVDQSLNAVVRFVLYLSVLLFFCSMDARYFLYVPTILLVTLALHIWFPKAKEMAITEAFRGSPFVSSNKTGETSLPTPDNPFMNATLPDIMDNPNRPPAADITDKTVRDQVNKAFSKTSNIYMDTSDVFDMVQAQRNFWSVVEDDHAGLLKFLGKNAKSDKLGSESYAVAKGTKQREKELQLSDSQVFATSQPTGTLPTSAISAL